jgi:hypothetical protein
MKFFLFPVFRVRRPQVFPNNLFRNRSCRRRVYRRVLPRLTRRLRPVLLSRFPRSPMPFNRPCFRKALKSLGMWDERGMEKPRQYFRPSLRCFLSPECRARSRLRAFQFCLRQCRRGLQLKPIFARCPLRSLVYPQLRPLTFLGPRFRVSPAVLPMRKERRSSLPLCRSVSSPLSSVPILLQGNLALPSVRSTRG